MKTQSKKNQVKKSQLKQKANQIKKVVSVQSNLTKKSLQEAYQIVKNDLFTTFTKMKDGQTIRLTNLGTFEKKFKKIKSGLTGKVHQYYQITFRMSKVLKGVLVK